MRYILIHGPRKSGKSLAIADKLMKVALQFPGADICILTRVLSKGEAGVWRNLTKPGGVVERWIKAGMTKYIGKRKGYAGPGYMPGSKVPYFQLKTRGAPSTFQLHTLADDESVEDKFKDMTFSHIYIVEADSFERDVFTTLQLCMRSTTVPFQFQQMFLDMNPPPEGEDHWAYKYFIGEPAPSTTAIFFPLDANTFISDEEKQGVYDSYAHDPVKLDRLYFGKWVKMAQDTCFADVLVESLHFIGEPIGATEKYDKLDEKEILRPWTNAFQLDLGWDIGDRSSAVVLAAPRFDGPTLCYDVLDEVASIRQHTTLDDIVDRVIDMMDYWAAWCLRENGKEAHFRHYSDTSSMNFKAPIGGSEAMLVRQLSHNRINLLPVSKGAGSIERRKDFLRRLLYENKIAISTRCIQTMNMLRFLPPRSIIEDSHDDKFRILDGVNKLSKHKHIFDALTYLLTACMPNHLAKLQKQEKAGRPSYSMSLA